MSNKLPDVIELQIARSKAALDKILRPLEERKRAAAEAEKRGAQ